MHLNEGTKIVNAIPTLFLGHGKPADWWSFGIFTYDLLIGRSPFSSNKGKKETKERILRGKFNMPNFVTRDAADLIRRLLRKPVDRRLGSVNGAADVKAHAFFRGVDWDAVVNKEVPPPWVPVLQSEDDADTSQFDPKFTSRSPRESVIKECPAVAEPPAVLFRDFEGGAPEVAVWDTAATAGHNRTHGD